jgi:hypothetical protein
MMWESLCKLAALPDDTLSARATNTRSNAAFAVTIEPDNAALVARKAQVAAAREKGPTVPSTLATEGPPTRSCAPLPEVKAALGMDGAPMPRSSPKSEGARTPSDASVRPAGPQFCPRGVPIRGFTEKRLEAGQ